MRNPLPAALLVVGLVLTGCSEDAAREPSADPTTQQTLEDGRVLGGDWPLTGLEVTGDDSAAQRHPVLVTKMDNTSSSAPQVGLSRADLVVEELVEGGVTRLAVFYYSQIPGNVGPVRSMRASDIGIVPDGARVVTSGAAPVTIRRIQDAGITFYGEGTRGMYRESSRSAPYNLFVRLDDVARTARVKRTRPDDYLEWGSAEDLPKGRKARTIRANFGNHTTEWRWDGKRYRNPGSFAAEDDQFPTDTVLVLRVEVGDAGYRDPAGYPVPETRLEGSGAAQLFHGGRMVKATWTKRGEKGAITLRTPRGRLEVPAGHTWVELVPRATGSVEVSPP